MCVSRWGLLVLFAVGACADSPDVTPTPVSSAPPAPLVVTLTQMSLEPQTVVSGEAAQGTVSLSIADPAGGTVVRLVVLSLRGYVELDLPAPPGGAIVALRTDDPAISVPSSVVIEERKLLADFSYSGGRPMQRVTFTATYGGTSESTTKILLGRSFPVGALARP